MVEVDTLFVISSARGDYVLNDTLSGIEAYNPSGAHFTVVVDETAAMEQLTGPGKHQLVHSDADSAVHSGFKRAQGLRWAIEAGIAFKQVIMLDDTCLIRGGPLGDFCLETVSRDGVGIMGVGDTKNYIPLWQSLIGLLYEMDLPHQKWEKPPMVLADAFLVLSSAFASVLHSRNLLEPAVASRWTGGYGAYAAWVAQMLNFYAVAWGYTQKSLPPFFVGSPNQYVPAPHILSDRFMLHSPVTRVTGYSEDDLRELWKQQRGEPARAVPPFKPTVFGPEGQVPA